MLQLTYPLHQDLQKLHIVQYYKKSYILAFVFLIFVGSAIIAFSTINLNSAGQAELKNKFSSTYLRKLQELKNHELNNEKSDTHHMQSHKKTKNHRLYAKNNLTEYIHDKNEMESHKKTKNHRLYAQNNLTEHFRDQNISNQEGFQNNGSNSRKLYHKRVPFNFTHEAEAKSHTSNEKKLYHKRVPFNFTHEAEVKREKRSNSHLKSQEISQSHDSSMKEEHYITLRQ